MLDAILLFYPWRVYAARALASGFIPLWNPDSFCGQPFLANVSSAVLYPLNVLFLLLDPARAYGFAAAIHVFLAGAFTYLFLRLFSLRPAAALLGGIAFMFCGFLTVWAEYQTPVDATIWLPLALYFWERYARGHGARFATYAAAPLGLSLLGGHLQYAVYVLLTFTAYAVWRAGFKPRLWVVAGCALALGITLAAHQILPSVELGRYNHRSGGQPLAGILANALPARQLVTFLVPNFLGNDIHYNYWGALNFIEMCGYLGILPVLLGGLALWLRRDRLTWFFALLAAITLLMMIGTPLYAPLYHLVPGFKQLSNPARMLGIFSLSVACLGAFAADGLAALPAARRRSLLWAVTALLFAGCAAAGVAYNLHASDIAERQLQDYVAGGVAVFLLLALLCSAAVLAAAARPAAIWALPAIAVFDLFLFGMSFNPAQDRAMLLFDTESFRLLRAQPGRFRILSLPDPGRDFMNTMIPNCNLVAGFPEVQGGDAMYPRRYREFAEFVESLQQRRPVKIGNGLTFSSPDTPGLDALGAEYILSAIPLNSTRLEYLGRPDMHVYRNRSAFPRAFLVHHARVEGSHHVLPAMKTEGFALDRIAIVERPIELPLASPQGPESARIERYERGRVRVAVRASSNALLLLTDQYFPGWRATIDGKQASVQPADYIFRAVAVPAGDHIVEFAYRPAAFRLGLFGTLWVVGLLAAVLSASCAFRRAVR